MENRLLWGETIEENETNLLRDHSVGLEVILDLIQGCLVHKKGKCIKQNAVNAAKIVKCRLSQHKASQFIVRSATERGKAGEFMYICKKCKSHKIKTKTNKSFGKSYSTAVNCKDCGSTDIINVNPKNRRYQKRR